MLTKCLLLRIEVNRILGNLKFLENNSGPAHGSESPAERDPRSPAGAPEQGCSLGRPGPSLVPEGPRPRWSARPHAPPSANGCEGSSLGKFRFRFLLPPVPLLLGSGSLTRLSTPPVPAETLHTLSCHRRRSPGPRHDAGHQVCGGGRWVGTWLNLLTAPYQEPWRPWGSPLPRRSPWEATRRNCPFFSQEPEGAPGGTEDSFTLSAHLTLETSWVEGTGRWVAMPGVPHLHSESWGRSPLGPQSSTLWMQVGVGSQKSALCPQADLDPSHWLILLCGLGQVTAHL